MTAISRRVGKLESLPPAPAHTVQNELNLGKLTEMTPDEIVDVLRANTGRRLRVTFLDGVIESVLIGSVDGEGFVHSGPDGQSPDGFWDTD